MDIIITIIIIGIFCNGWKIITHDGMILDPVRKWYVEIFGLIEYSDRVEGNGFFYWLYKPLFGCIICYASVWGSAVYCLLNEFYWKEYIVVIIGSSFGNYMFYLLRDKLEK